MLRFIRLMIVVAAHTLSPIAVIFSLTPITVLKPVDPLNSDNLQAHLIFMGMYVFVYAWMVHIILALSWIADKKLKKFWPISGSIAGVFSYLHFAYIFPLHSHQTLIDKLVPLLILTFPLLLLTIYLVWFHLSATCKLI